MWLIEERPMELKALPFLKIHPIAPAIMGIRRHIDGK